ncbi:hypothetical protein [Amycolatopsis magusensis]|uniref:hypothetical protein n=1 Tax=Amycolatopsis magusensis TaxID=882444 RepID=UPI0024A9F75D|nr:hypothetical protein [Amycolatopsis magusensis]MDI5981304.1 hypothetical protein [Amycolatopsis magusensis]
MAEVAADQRGAQRAGRWASRALVVAGGVLAGTAAAWAFATGASATEIPDATEPGAADLTPVTDATVAGLNDTTGGVAELTGDVAGAAAQATSLPTFPQQQRSSDEIDEIDEDVAAAVDEFTSDAVVRPVERTLGAFEHIVRQPEDAPKVIEQTLTPAQHEVEHFGRDFWVLLQPTADSPLPFGNGDPEIPEQPLTAAPDARTAEVYTVAVPGAPADSGSWSDGFGAARAGGPADEGDAGDRELPSPFSPVRAPLAPLTAPTLPGGGNSAGGHFDGLLAGVPAGAAAAFDTATIGSVRSGVRHLMVDPGAQPGVTPD